MSKLIIGTNFINSDEPCMELAEVNLQSPGSKGFHRYQIIKVIRNDRVREFRLDLGKAEDFKADQIVIPGGVKDDLTGRFYCEETVGRLREVADQMRYKPPIETDYLPRTDLVKGYEEHLYNKKKQRKGQVKFGYSNAK